MLLDNRHGLVANVCVTAATGTAEREGALLLLGEAPHAATVGGDKAFDVPSFVEQVRALGVTPHVDPEGEIHGDRRPDARHTGYAISQQKRKLIEQIFGWMKTIGGLAEAATLRRRTGRSDRDLAPPRRADLVRLRTLLTRPA